MGLSKIDADTAEKAGEPAFTKPGTESSSTTTTSTTPTSTTSGSKRRIDWLDEVGNVNTMTEEAWQASFRELYKQKYGVYPEEDTVGYEFVNTSPTTGGTNGGTVGGGTTTANTGSTTGSNSSGQGTVTTGTGGTGYSNTGTGSWSETRSPLDDSTSVTTGSCTTTNICVPVVNVPEVTRNLASASTDTTTKETIAGLTADGDKIDKIICSTTLVSDILKLDENVLDKVSFTNDNPDLAEKFNSLKNSLNGAIDTFSSVDQEVLPLKVQNLTEELVDGNGVFDVIMSAVYNQLDNLRKNNRITAQEFSQIYATSLTGILEIASSHLINMEQSYWQNQLVREQVIAAKYANLEAQAKVISLPLVLEQQYAQTQQAVKQVDLLTVQTEAERLRIPQIQAQTLGLIEQNRLTKAQWHKTAKEAKLVDATLLETKAKIKLMAEQIKKERENLDMIKAQVAESYARIALVSEQMKAAKAQYSDTIDGKPVRGIIGTQNALHRKQSMSYDRDSLYKMLSLQAQGWQTKKTADIGTKSPAVFTAAGIDGMFEQYIATYYNNPNEAFQSLGTGQAEAANGLGSADVYGRVSISKVRPVDGYSDYVTDAEMDAEVPTKTGNTGL
mgnify:FL=1